MAISLTEIIAALEAKSNATDSSTAISDILRLTQASETVSDGTILYDSAGVMPTDSAFIGTLAATSAGTIYFYNGTAWNAVDSAETIITAPSLGYQGTSFGYTSGGYEPGGFNQIEKYSFTVDQNATDVGDLTLARGYGGGNSSSVSGYVAGGYPPPTNTNIIDKFPFSTDTNASDVGDLTVARFVVSSQSSSTYGYTSGGFPSDVIDKFPFSTDANATDVGNILNANETFTSGQSSTTYGYVSGGRPGPSTNSDRIQKFPFSSDANSIDVANLTSARALAGSSQPNSLDYGYMAGGFIWPPAPTGFRDIIDKFPFASDADATDVGDLTVARRGNTGSSSNISGYIASGSSAPSPPGDVNIIEKFPFTTDANAADVGDLIVSRSRGQSQQV